MLKFIHWRLWIVCLILINLSLYAQDGSVKYLGYSIRPEAMIKTPMVSKSRWLWAPNAPVRDGAVVFFRCSIDISEVVRDAFLNISYDDLGQLYVNGHISNGKNLKNELKLGRNTLGFKLINRRSAAGLLFYGEIKLQSGKILYLHSNKQIKATQQEFPNWYSEKFDDSAWGSALELGDVKASPWGLSCDYVAGFTSAAEKKQINKLSTEVADNSSDGLTADTPDTVAKIIYQGQVPQIEVNGQALNPFWLVPDMNGYFGPFQNNIILKMRELGVRFFEIRTRDNFFYRAPGNYDFSALERQAKFILKLVPDAWIFVSFRTGNMTKWCQDNPLELVGYATGAPDPKCRDERIGRPIRPSAASSRYRQEVFQELKALSCYLKKQSWQRRIVGFRLNYGIYFEWHTYGMYDSPDTGKRMTEAFRRFLANKYGTDAALQKAWNNSRVTLNSATAPTAAMRHNPQGFLLDPVKNLPALDFFECNAQVHADFLINLGKEIKKYFPNKLCGAYYGYVFSNHPPEGANVMLEQVLSSPYIDFLSNPLDYSYLTRGISGDGDHRTVTNIFRRYGKLAVLEDDNRFHQNYVSLPYASKTPRESQMIARRDICNQLFNGAGIHFFDAESGTMVRPHYFDDPAVLTGLQEGIRVYNEVKGNLTPDSGNDTVVVINERERLRHDNKLYKTPWGHNLYKVTKQQLYRSGVGLDIKSYKDFMMTSQSYKVAIFLNLFSLTPAENQALRQKIQRDKINAVWLLAPGCVTPTGFSDAAMSKLTGFQLQGAGTNPQIICLDKNINVLAPGVIQKKFAANLQSIFCFDVPTSSAKWQQILKCAGSHIYTSPGNYFRRHGNIFMYSTAVPGTYTISLPEGEENCQELFTGQQYGGNLIKLETAKENLWLFEIKPSTFWQKLQNIFK